MLFNDLFFKKKKKKKKSLLIGPYNGQYRSKRD